MRRAAWSAGAVLAGFAFGALALRPQPSTWASRSIRYNAPTQGHYVRWRIEPASGARRAVFRFSWRSPGDGRWRSYGAGVWLRGAGAAVQHTWQGPRFSPAANDLLVDSWLGPGAVEFLVASDVEFTLTDITDAPAAREPSLRFDRAP